MRVSIVALLFAASCGSSSSQIDAGDSDDSGANIDAPAQIDARPPGADAAVATCTPASGTALDLELVAEGLERPVLVTAPPGDKRLFIVEQPGRIRIVKDGALLPTPFLDIDPAVRDTGNEQGLLGLAFHPDFATNGRFYVDYIAQDPQADSVVAEYRVTGANPDIADDSTEQRLMVIDQPASNHNGGMLEFGADGFLYISLGDGGSQHDPDGNGQNTKTWLGSILRIDVDTGSPYGIPAGNPFANSANGIDDPRPEIWAWGLRNPWRFSFDRQTDYIYIGDVGQDAWEEINIGGTGAGINYGWRVMEGDQCFMAATCDQAGLAGPIVAYSHGGGRCSVTGGYVYRGSCIPGIQGWYFYGDACTDQIWKIEYPGNNTPVDLSAELGTGVIESLSSFGQDATGELYVTSLLNGRVFKIVPAAN